MNLKHLIKFGMEESQEPVIKNPILRQALEPRTMDLADGGRIGFLKGKSVKEKQQAGNVAKQQVKFDRIAKLFKDEDWTGLKTKTRPARIKEGTQVDTGGKLISQDTKMLNDIIEGGTKAEKTALAKKLGITRDKMIEGWKKSKAKIATELSENLSKQQLKKIEFQKKLYNEISNNPGTIKEMAKRLKVDEKYLVQQSSKLLKNVYTQNVAIAKGPEFDLDARGKATLKSWLPDDFKSTDKFLDNFANIDGLKKVQTENMGILIRNAYRNNPKKYTEALKILGDYNKFVNSLPKGVKIDLDHPLSKAFLKGSGVSPDKLLYVTPVDRGFNRGFKKQLGDKYTQALNMTDPILKKEAIKNVRTLADKTGINIGDVTGKKYDYGTTHLLDKKKNFQKEFFKNLKEQNLVAENLKNLKKTKEGKKIIKDVFPTGKIEVKKVKANILNAFCGSKRKPLATAGAVDGLVCSMDEIQENIKKQTNQAMKATKDGKLPKKFGKLRNLAKFFGWIDAPIEFFFAAPHLIAGDIEGAKRATTLGLGGWGKVDLDKISDKEAQRYLKHTKAMNDYFDNYGTAITTEKELENLTPGTGAYDLMTNQFETAKANMEDIQKSYQDYGYTYEEGDTPIQGKVAAQKYIRDKVKSDFEKKIDKQATTEAFKDADKELLKEQLRDLGGRPEKVTPITDLESYMENKGEEMAGNTNLFFNVKPYVLEEAEALGVPEIFDDYALGAGVEGYGRKSLQDAYSEIPIEYANQLAALEKKQLEEGLLKKRLSEGFAGGGIASLKKKW
jgi:hypothetical protein